MSNDWKLMASSVATGGPRLTLDVQLTAAAFASAALQLQEHTATAFQQRLEIHLASVREKAS
jgi:hypothetical protein